MAQRLLFDVFVLTKCLLTSAHAASELAHIAESKRDGFRQATCRTDFHMRQLHKFGDCYRSQQRGFFTEDRFLKFVQPCDQDNLTNRILPKPDTSTNTTTPEVVGFAQKVRLSDTLARCAGVSCHEGETNPCFVTLDGYRPQRTRLIGVAACHPS